MSDNIGSKLKTLELQYSKLKQILERVLHISNEETLKTLIQNDEAEQLYQSVCEIEQEKAQFAEELNLYLSNNPNPAISVNEKSNEIVEINDILDNLSNEIELEAEKIEQLHIEDVHLKETATKLNTDKNVILGNIELIKKANDENKLLDEENLKMRQDLSSLLRYDAFNDSQALSFTTRDLCAELSSAIIFIFELENELIESRNASKNPLNVATENTILELKLSKLEKQKEAIINDLRRRLLFSGHNISKIYQKTAQNILTSSLNEVCISKNLLMLNLGNVQKAYEGKTINEVNNTGSKCIENCNLTCYKADTSIIPLVDGEITENHLTSKQIDLSQLSISIEKFNLDINSATDNPSSMSSFSTNSSEIIQKVIDIKDSNKMTSDYSLDAIPKTQDGNELETVSEEDEYQTNMAIKQKRLINEITRLENEKLLLKQQLENISLPIEHLSHKNVKITESNRGVQQELSACIETPESATTTEGQGEEMLKQFGTVKIYEIIEENDSDKEDSNILKRGEKIIRNNGGSVGDILKSESNPDL